jgi:hypothetical protein
VPNSRRQFLQAAAVFSVGCATAVWAVRSRDRLRPWARDWYRRTAFPPLEGGTPGELSETTLAALVAASAIAIGFDVEMTRYADLFRWRAANLPGYRDLYEEFAERADRIARRRGNVAFGHAPAQLRRDVLAEVFGRAFAAQSRLERLLAGTLDRGRLRLRDHTVGDALRLFARTDALVRLGYDGWPGMARGLETYTQALPGHLAPRS